MTIESISDVIGEGGVSVARVINATIDGMSEKTTIVLRDGQEAFIIRDKQVRTGGSIITSIDPKTGYESVTYVNDNNR